MLQESVDTFDSMTPISDSRQIVPQFPFSRNENKDKCILKADLCKGLLSSLQEIESQRECRAHGISDKTPNKMIDNAPLVINMARKPFSFVETFISAHRLKQLQIHVNATINQAEKSPDISPRFVSSYSCESTSCSYL